MDKNKGYPAISVPVNTDNYWLSPIQAKTELEWATRPYNAVFVV
jgi:hypothetical protein